MKIGNVSSQRQKNCAYFRNLRTLDTTKSSSYMIVLFKPRAGLWDTNKEETNTPHWVTRYEPRDKIRELELLLGGSTTEAGSTTIF